MFNKNSFESSNSQTRNYGIDLLRNISMLMVATLHVLGHGGVLNTTNFGSLNYGVAWLIDACAFAAVNCYALISGYVGVYAKYKLSNLVELWFRVLYYSVALTVICKLVSPESVGNGTMLFSFAPVLTKRYWYFTAYFVLFLFIPILNTALNRLSKKRNGRYSGGFINVVFGY